MRVAAEKQVIIVGGGHNGLVAAAYLARAGLDVQVLERRELVGGAAVTEEWFPGYRLSSCSYICHLLQGKVIEELELRKHGFRVFSMEPKRFMPFPNGNFLRIWHDDDKTAEEIARVSPRDAESYPHWMSFWKRASRILNEHFLSPPPTLTELFDRAREMGERDVLETLLTVPLKDLLEAVFRIGGDQILCLLAGRRGRHHRGGQRLRVGLFHVGGLPRRPGELRTGARGDGHDYHCDGAVG